MSDETVHQCPYVPNPGSDEAIGIGCICAVLDNNHGRGKGPFWITGGCPVHDPQEDDVQIEGERQ